MTPTAATMGGLCSYRVTESITELPQRRGSCVLGAAVHWLFRLVLLLLLPLVGRKLGESLQGIFFFILFHHQAST